MAVDVTVTTGIKESGLLLLVPHTAIDDEVDAVPEGLGEAGGGAGALLVAVVERRRGACAGGDQLVETDGGIDQPAAGKSELLVVAGHRQKRLQVRRRIVDIADPV